MRIDSVSRWCFSPFLVVGLAAAAQLRAAVVFQRLDFLPSDVSADGSVVVGGRGNEAVRWTAAGGTAGIGTLPGRQSSFAAGVSADGSVVVGASYVGFGSERSDGRAFRWTAATGMTDLGTLPGRTGGVVASAVSADGSVVVGTADAAPATPPQAFLWTKSIGMVAIGTGATARAVSADGSVVVGSRSLDPTWEEPYPWPARWTGPTGWEGLGYFGGAHAASADGSVVVGTTFDPSLMDPPGAFRWTASTGSVYLGNLPGVWSSGATDVSADGSVVVGSTGPDAGNVSEAAFIWNEVDGMRRLQDVLERLGADLTGVSMLGGATAISADGRTIVGEAWGSDPSQPFGWVATVPEPAGLPLLAVAAVALLRRRRSPGGGERR